MAACPICHEDAEQIFLGTDNSVEFRCAACSEIYSEPATESTEFNSEND